MPPKPACGCTSPAATRWTPASPPCSPHPWWSSRISGWAAKRRSWCAPRQARSTPSPGRHHAEDGHRRFLSQPQTAPGRDRRPTRTEGAEGLGSRRRHPERPRAGHGRSRPRDLARVRNQVVQRGHSARHRPGRWFPPRRSARQYPGRLRYAICSNGRPRRRCSCPTAARRKRRDFPPARPGADAAGDGRSGEESARLGGAAARRRSTPSATSSTAATSPTASTISKANNGLLRYEDIAAFKLEPEEPVSTTFHGYNVYKPGFWSRVRRSSRRSILLSLQPGGPAAQFGRTTSIP